MAARERRRRYLVKKGLQFRYLGLILAAVVLPVIFVSGCLYYLIFFLMAEQLAIPESIAYNLLPVFNKINFMLLVGTPALVLLLLCLGLIISHRIAGPIYRLEKDLDEIAKGNFSIRIKMRRNDELISLAEKINKILQRVQEKAG